MITAASLSCDTIAIKTAEKDDGGEDITKVLSLLCLSHRSQRPIPKWGTADADICGRQVCRTRFARGKSGRESVGVRSLRARLPQCVAGSTSQMGPQSDQIRPPRTCTPQEQILRPETSALSLARCPTAVLGDREWRKGRDGRLIGLVDVTLLWGTVYFSHMDRLLMVARDTEIGAEMPGLPGSTLPPSVRN